MKNENNLSKLARISVFAAIVTILLKFAAYQVTESVGLLSDAIESFVNLIAALITVWMLQISSKPPDDDHAYGHTKAEYFASVLEGVFIFIAAIAIFYTSFNRILSPINVSEPWLGIVMSVAASIINGAVAIYLLKMAKKHNSLALEADAHHLMTDVWTSVAVVLGIVIVAFTNIKIIDPIVAIVVACNILVTGFDIIRRSVDGLMDRSLPERYLEPIFNIFNNYEKQGVAFHAFRSRVSGAKAFASVHVLVPGAWSVQKGHDLLEDIERKVKNIVPSISFVTHIEPKEDEKSFRDIS